MANEVPEDLEEKLPSCASLGDAGRPESRFPRNCITSTSTPPTIITRPDPSRVSTFRILFFPIKRRYANPGGSTGPNGLLLVFHRSADW